MTHFSSLILVSLVLNGLVGCSDDSSPKGDGAAGNSAETIEPKLSIIQTTIFDKNCALSGCHGPGETPEFTAGKSRTNLVDRASNHEAGKKLVIAGNPEESMLYQVLKGAVGSVEQMPQGQKKLDANKVEAIRQWIAEGAQDN